MERKLILIIDDPIVADSTVETLDRIFGDEIDTDSENDCNQVDGPLYERAAAIIVEPGPYSFEQGLATTGDYARFMQRAVQDGKVVFLATTQINIARRLEELGGQFTSVYIKPYDTIRMAHDLAKCMDLSFPPRLEPIVEE